MRMETEMTLRMLAIIAALAALPANATADTIRLGNRDGGYVALHMAQARQWLRHRHKLVLTGDQISAAAIQVAWYRQHGGSVCAWPGVALWFHASSTGRTFADTGWHEPGEFGIPTCPGKRSSEVKVMKW